MANYRAIASGNWNTGSTWDGGSVPPNGAGHNVYSNTFTVTIDTNINVNLISNAAITATFVGGATSSAVGGGYSVSGAYNIAITSSLGAAAVPCLSVSTPLGITTTYSGNISAPSVTGSSIIFSGAGKFQINTGNISGTSSTLIPITNSGSGNLEVNNGIITAGPSGAGSAHAIVNASNGFVTCNTCTLTASTQGYAINNNVTGSVIINNSTITGAQANQGVNNGISAILQCNNCSITGGPSTGVGIVNTGSITCTGCTFTATNTASAITSSGTTRLSGTFVSATNGQQPINSTRWILNTAPTTSYIQQALDGINALSYVRYYTSDNNPNGGVAATDVRRGVSYGGGLVGTCAVPNAGTVAFGVPVDNTVGTATLTAANVRAALGMSSANLDTQLAAIPTAVTNANAVRTNLATELGRIDATISSRSTLTAANVRTELTPELTQVTEVHKIHGLDIANALTVTPTLRSAGAITQAITGDGTTNTIVTRV